MECPYHLFFSVKFDTYFAPILCCCFAPLCVVSFGCCWLLTKFCARPALVTVFKPFILPLHPHTSHTSIRLAMYRQDTTKIFALSSNVVIMYSYILHSSLLTNRLRQIDVHLSWHPNSLSSPFPQYFSCNLPL